MAPAASSSDRPGPHPSYIEISQPYMMQSSIEAALTERGMSDAREDAVRLQGVMWIDNVRRRLQLPVKTFNTAVVYYHKFRLRHADSEYNWADASAAALLCACKIEDTQKKSREILCASWNLKLAPSEQLTPDDPRFENPSKLIMGLERLMLESARFDFRGRHPQKLVVKMAKAVGFDREVQGRTAWNLSLDLYRTFAPVKQTSATMAIACVELAARLHKTEPEAYVDKGIMEYKKWHTTRAEVMETMLDLLDLYTHHRTSTAVGPLYSLETFIDVRIGLNQEASAANIPRYALYKSEASQPTNGATYKPRNGIDPTSPNTPATPGTISPSQAPAPAHADKTVRFMLDVPRARHERAEVDKYWKVEEEEYEVEVPIEEPERKHQREEAKVASFPKRKHNQEEDTQSPGRGRGFRQWSIKDTPPASNRSGGSVEYQIRGRGLMSVSRTGLPNPDSVGELTPEGRAPGFTKSRCANTSEDEVSKKTPTDTIKTTESTQPSGPQPGVWCIHCRKWGHSKSNCPKAEAQLEDSRDQLKSDIRCMECAEWGHSKDVCPDRNKQPKIPREAVVSPANHLRGVEQHSALRSRTNDGLEAPASGKQMNPPRGPRGKTTQSKDTQSKNTPSKDIQSKDTPETPAYRRRVDDRRSVEHRYTPPTEHPAYRRRLDYGRSVEHRYTAPPETPAYRRRVDDRRSVEHRYTPPTETPAYGRRVDDRQSVEHRYTAPPHSMNGGQGSSVSRNGNVQYYPRGPKCFSCDQFGHKAWECPNGER